MVERAAVNRDVVGSSPTSGANLCHRKNLVSAVSSESNGAGVFDFSL